MVVIYLARFVALLSSCLIFYCTPRSAIQYSRKLQPLNWTVKSGAEADKMHYRVVKPFPTSPYFRNTALVLRLFMDICNQWAASQTEPSNCYYLTMFFFYGSSILSQTMNSSIIVFHLSQCLSIVLQFLISMRIRGTEEDYLKGSLVVPVWFVLDH